MLQFCVDYCVLNSDAKPDLFPLPRIDDFLNQLGSPGALQHWTLLQGIGKLESMRTADRKQYSLPTRDFTNLE